MDAATPERWLPPRADTVVALAEAGVRTEAFAWGERLRGDPGLVWFFFTHHADLSLERTLPLLRQGTEPHAVLDVVLHESHGRLADWARPTAARAYKLSQFVGALAERLATQVRLDPLLAHCLGQMTQLGPLVLSQASETKPSSKDPSVHTRQLVRRVNGPAWLREL